MNPGFLRRDAVLSVSAAQHSSSLAAAARLQSEGYTVSVVGPGAQDIATQWAQSGTHVDVSEAFSAVSSAPAIAVLKGGEVVSALGSPNLLWLGSVDAGTLAGGRAIDNLDTWVEDYLAPRVPRFPRLG